MTPARPLGPAAVRENPMTKQEAVAFHDRYKITAIARRIPSDRIADAAAALYEGGIRLLEITFDQADPAHLTKTPAAIRAVRERMGDRMLIGAGTVLTTVQARAAADAGASFMLAPNTDPEVIRCANDLGLVTFPGAMTPTEIAAAYNAGADYVKVFPAGALGVDYIKAILGPISHVPMTAVGGITLNNMNAFLAAGMKGVGIGSNLVSRKLIEDGDYEGLTALAAGYASQLEH